MKKLSLGFFLAFALLSFSLVSAQMDECQIKYKVDVSGSDMEPMMKMMMQNAKMELAFKGRSARMEMNMGMMGSTTVITNDNTKRGLLLMNMLGMKYATPMDEQAYEKNKDGAPKLTFKETGKTKEIAGYTCRQAIGTDAEGNTFDCWYSDKIKPKSVFSGFDFTGLKGFPLEMETLQDGMKVKMIAQTVKTESLDNAKFSLDIPSGYTEKSMEELEKMGQKF